MDTAKASISVGDASIQLEGSQEFVEKYLDQYASLIQRWYELPKSRAETAKASESKKEEAAPKRTRVVMPKGASCGDRIRTLIDENYFAEPKGASEITKWLKDQKGVTYNVNQVTASLTGIIRSQKLRRVKDAGVYKYINP